MNLEDLDEIGKKVAEFVHTLDPALPVPKVAFNSFMFTALGATIMSLTDPHRALIRFSAPLWPILTPEDRANTIAHEVAHYVATNHFGQGGQGHAERWQETVAKISADERPKFLGTPEQKAAFKNLTDPANIPDKKPEAVLSFMLNGGAGWPIDPTTEELNERTPRKNPRVRAGRTR